VNHIEFRGRVNAGTLDKDGGGRRKAQRDAARKASADFLSVTAPMLRQMAERWQQAAAVNAYTHEDVAVIGEIIAELTSALASLPNVGRIVATRLTQSDSWRNEHGIQTSPTRRTRVRRENS
jgi:hypothetical protein